MTFTFFVLMCIGILGSGTHLFIELYALSIDLNIFKLPLLVHNEINFEFIFTRIEITLFESIFILICSITPNF